MKRARNDDRVKSEAMDWVLRHDAGALSTSEVETFGAWLAESPRHRELFASAEAFWNAAAELEGHPRMAETRQWALAATGRAWLTRRVVAAGFAAGVLGLGGLVIVNGVGSKPLASQAFSTAIGQRAAVTLPDGSTVTLNTDTRVRTVADRNRRLVYLDRGQAFFRVAKDTRHPFVVTAGGRTITALGTAFEVRLDKGALRVVLVEGRVRVQAPQLASTAVTGETSSAGAPISTDMSAGSQLVAADHADWRVSPVNTVQETSWLKGQLIFDDEALGDVVAELNRYSSRKMVFAEPGLTRLRISGVYTPGDVQAFTLALKDAKVADVKERADGQIEIVALQ
ncbi:MAG TPA: FecR domain-containing protein [Caulobacteraceae bacterium]